MSSNGTPALQANLNYGLRNCRRYICSHDADDKSFFVDSPELLYMDVQGAYASARSYAVEKIPAPLKGDQDLNSYLSEDGEKNITSHLNASITIPGGVNMVCVNFATGSNTAMHRTVSLDFAICIEGEIEMELDNGDTRILGPGVSGVMRNPCSQSFLHNSSEV
jgi:hypothetical protein